MSNWYYESNGTQAGPVTMEVVLAMVGRGELGPASLVWTDGMPGWQAVSQTSALAVVSSPTPAPAPVAPGGFNPYAPPSVAYQPAPVPEMRGFPFVKRANYGLSMALLLSGFAGIIVGAIGMEANPRNEVVFGIFAGVGGILLLVGAIQFLIYLYRAWLVLQPHTSRSTPGKAVGFLFIPLFSIYWKFVAYWRWSEEWNRLVANVRPGAPRMTEGVFLAYAITGAAALIAGAFAALPSIILFLIAMRQVCNAVNYAADHPA
ncbi:DUF4339 domain-containing protein [Luteolibacter ambystomatis]|uniref:DUF4339 domain-containing protein n=1 Tax=Luteolibacter ambystomatis TaxID=2824561 RepID=A0A975G831_9BACT|nr:DUF4339 domain-containing protein [Luteolibacter ambystomatis]QUE50486.1 DUF4339 domain-containing protein [Luteolibacter ambystomatis]